MELRGEVEEVSEGRVVESEEMSVSRSGTDEVDIWRERKAGVGVYWL